MAFTINWVEPANNSVGSVLIYRATDNKLDSLGSRTVIATAAAKDISGSWVISYTDASGTDDNIYRIQFWDGVGSTPLSEPIGQESNEQLASFQEVLLTARLQRSYEIGSDIVYEAISSATDEVYATYGDPVKKTTFTLDSTTGVNGAAYNFTGELCPVYQVREVYVDTSDLDIVPNTAYTINYGQGAIKFTSDFIGSYTGKNIYVNWVPSSINLLVKNMAALELVEGELILAGRNVTNPQVERLHSRIGSVQEIIRPKGIYAPRLFSDLNTGYEYIPQMQDRKYLYFN